MRYSNDPKWLTARFNSICHRCGKPIRKGERLFYFPLNRVCFCKDEKCGVRESAQFESAAQDEAFYNGGY